ncbi:MAG: fumarylacetoacetate hydrolase family protein [Chloroflexi bacterium]|nr:fumarylacetoacetate hydrolase family protein [Chloroflexota bacterium]
MRLFRFLANEDARLGVEIGEFLIDLAAGRVLLGQQQGHLLCTVGADMRAFLGAGDMAMAAASKVREIVARGIANGQSLEGPNGERIAYRRSAVRILAPLPNPEKLLMLGLNYRDHAVETGLGIPPVPAVFAKLANAITGPHDPIVLPRAASKEVDYEAEMAFVVGKRAKGVPQKRAYDYVAGYTALNDVSARDLQFGQSQWLMGKTPDTFAPMGPCIVTRDEITDPHKLTIRCSINGKLLQDSNTGNLIFDVPYLLHHLSQTITLEPGDVISTGTPAGVGYARKPPVYLRAGDIVRVEIGSIGALENPVVEERLTQGKR